MSHDKTLTVLFCYVTKEMNLTCIRNSNIVSAFLCCIIHGVLLLACLFSFWRVSIVFVT